MYLLRKAPKGRGLDEPLLHPDHAPPVTRRQFLSAGLIGGSATVIVPGLIGAAMSGKVHADVIADLDAAMLDATGCGISGGAGKVPFICFDLSPCFERAYDLDEFPTHAGPIHAPKLGQQRGCGIRNQLPFPRTVTDISLGGAQRCGQLRVATL